MRLEVDVNSLRTINEKFAAWRRYRDAVRELSQLSDRELDGHRGSPRRYPVHRRERHARRIVRLSLGR